MKRGTAYGVLAGALALGAALGGVLLWQRRRSRQIVVAPVAVTPVSQPGQPPAVSADTPVSFIFISDTHGAAASNKKLIDALQSESGVAFIAHGGDLADSEDLWGAWWDTPFGRLSTPVLATRGNHDPESGFSRRFRTLPYKVRAGSADLFFIPYNVTSSVVSWLDRETAASPARFKILVSHRPVWSARGEPGLASKLSASLPRLNLVLVGHEHLSWDSTHNVDGKAVRQITEISGPKKYTCGSVLGCVPNSTGYTRVTVSSMGFNIQRKEVR